MFYKVILVLTLSLWGPWWNIRTQNYILGWDKRFTMNYLSYIYDEGNLIYLKKQETKDGCKSRIQNNEEWLNEMLWLWKLSKLKLIFLHQKCVRYFAITKLQLVLDLMLTSMYMFVSLCICVQISPSKLNIHFVSTKLTSLFFNPDQDNLLLKI